MPPDPWRAAEPRPGRPPSFRRARQEQGLIGSAWSLQQTQHGFYGQEAASAVSQATGPGHLGQLAEGNAATPDNDSIPPA